MFILSYNRNTENSDLKNRIFVLEVCCRVWTYNDTSMPAALIHKAQVSTKLIETLQERFRSFDEKIWESMKWFDAKFWTFKKDFGEDQIAYLTKHFEVPLSNTHFDVSKVGVEWKSFKRYVNII